MNFICQKEQYRPVLNNILFSKLKKIVWMALRRVYSIGVSKSSVVKLWGESDLGGVTLSLILHNINHGIKQ